MQYAEFLEQKSHLSDKYGFEPVYLPDFLFDFQRQLVSWALEKGRAAIFADCGLGKTPMQLVWAENIVRKTGKNVLILTPLAVSSQTIREAEKFNIEAYHSRHGEIITGINVTNYERLHYLKPDDFTAVVCDESSILKSFDGARRSEITEFMKKVPYRLLCTATAAPNDYIELGTSSEALGELGHTDMLMRFFKNDQSNIKARTYLNRTETKWRFKGHAEIPFWKWVCSWARAIRRPSDLGCDDGPFILPPLIETEHLIDVEKPREGYLFSLPAFGLYEQREERRITIRERCEKVAEIVSGTERPALVWCHLNDEGDLLSEIIPDGVEVSGSDSDEKKESAFLSFINGDIRVLITKPKIGAWGLNFQHCSHITFFPSHSFEQYYQGVRRCWRFGQQNQVQVDVITTKGEQGVLSNLRRKAEQADRMFSNLVREMSESITIDRGIRFEKEEVIPQWL